MARVSPGTGGLNSATPAVTAVGRRHNSSQDVLCVSGNFHMELGSVFVISSDDKRKKRKERKPHAAEATERSSGQTASFRSAGAACPTAHSREKLLG